MERVLHSVGPALAELLEGQMLALRQLVYARDRCRCHICGYYVAFSDSVVEHVVPLSRGGSWDDENLKLAHSICNSRKARKLLEELPPIEQRSLWRFSNWELSRTRRAA